MQFDRYLLLDPPVRLLYGMQRLDGFYDVPLALPEPERDAEVRRILRKAVTVAMKAQAARLGTGSYSRIDATDFDEGTLTPEIELPFSNREAEFLIGLAFRRSLQVLLYASQQREDLGVLLTERRPMRRLPAYQEIGDYSFEMYLYAFVLPYYRDRLGTVTSADELIEQNDLHALADPLRGNPDLRVVRQPQRLPDQRRGHHLAHRARRRRAGALLSAGRPSRQPAPTGGPGGGDGVARRSRRAGIRVDATPPVKLGRVCVAQVLVLCLGCATPIGVRRVDPREVYRTNTESVLTSETPSVGSRQVLLRLGLFERFQRNPIGVLVGLHERTLAELVPDQLFALAEFSQLHAERSGDASYHVAAALYAFAFLFPDDGTASPDALDPRTRTAASLYNRAVSNALTRDGDVASFGPLALPPHVGRIETSFDEQQLRWAGRRLVELVPAADLEIRGLRNRYRRAGVGAAFAARPAAEPGAELLPMERLISEDMRVPVSVLLRFESPRAGLRAGEQRAVLAIYNAREDETAQVSGRSVPVEYETSATLALSLDGSPIWDSGIAGFRNPVGVSAQGKLQLWARIERARFRWSSCTARRRAWCAGPR